RTRLKLAFLQRRLRTELARLSFIYESTMKTLLKDRQKRTQFDDSAILACAESGGTVAQRVALIDSRGNIVAVNRDWMALAEKTGTPLSRVGIGVNYLQVCRQAAGSCIDSRKAHAGIYSVLEGKTSSFVMDYTSHGHLGPAYFRMNVTPIDSVDI